MGIEEKLELEDGILKYEGVPSIVFLKSTEEMLYKEIFNFAGKGVLKAFRRCGYEGGKDFYKYLLELVGIRNDKDPLEFTEAEREKLIETYFKLLGGSTSEMSSFQTTADGFILRFEGDVLPEALKGEVDYPVCALDTGYYEALFSQIYGQEVTVEEKLCIAKGDPCCEHHIKIKKE